MYESSRQLHPDIKRGLRQNRLRRQADQWFKTDESLDPKYKAAWNGRLSQEIRDAITEGMAFAVAAETPKVLAGQMSKLMTDKSPAITINLAENDLNPRFLTSLQEQTNDLIEKLDPQEQTEGQEPELTWDQLMESAEVMAVLLLTSSYDKIDQNKLGFTRQMTRAITRIGILKERPEVQRPAPITAALAMAQEAGRREPEASEETTHSGIKGTLEKAEKVAGDIEDVLAELATLKQPQPKDED